MFAVVKMPIMSRFEEQLKGQMIKRMSIDNPWWLSGTIAEDYKAMPKRMYLDEFYPLITDRSIRRAVILMGPRRVGKTVMIFHAINKLIEEGVNPHKIIYISKNLIFIFKILINRTYTHPRPLCNFRRGHLH